MTHRTALCISRRETRMSGDAVAEMIRRERITTAVLTPAGLGALPPGELPSLRLRLSLQAARSVPQTRTAPS